MHKLMRVVEAVREPRSRKSLSFATDQYGQREALIKPDGVEILYEYDQKGRLAACKASDNSFAYAYEYNFSDLPTKITDLIQNNTTIRVYDGSDRMISETLANGSALSMSMID